MAGIRADREGRRLRLIVTLVNETDTKHEGAEFATAPGTGELDGEAMGSNGDAMVNKTLADGDKMEVMGAIPDSSSIKAASVSIFTSGMVDNTDCPATTSEATAAAATGAVASGPVTIPAPVSGDAERVSPTAPLDIVVVDGGEGSSVGDTVSSFGVRCIVNSC